MTENDSAPGAKKGLLDALRNLLGGEPAAPRNARLSSFETTVEKLLQLHGKAVLGRLHFLNLEELIIRRGEGQKTRLKKVENVFLSVIGKNLKEDETYVRPEVGSVFFLFPKLTREAGDLKCAVIADQIARALVEEDQVFAELKSEKTVQNINQKTWNASRAARLASASLVQRDGPPSPPAANADRRLEGIEVAYQAIWNVRSKMITSYAAVSRRRHPDGTIAKGKLILGTDTGFAMIAALDSFVLRKSVAWLHGLMDVRQQTLLVLPVHFTTVDSQAFFQPYRRELAALSEEERKYIVLEILRAPDTLPAFRIKDIVSRLRPFARCVLIRLHPGSAFIRHWAEGGIPGVGFAAGEEKLSEKFLMEKMDAFVASAEKAGVYVYAHDLATSSLATAAVVAGFRYVGGEAILPESEGPNPIEPFECQNIFARLIGA